MIIIAITTIHFNIEHYSSLCLSPLLSSLVSSGASSTTTNRRIKAAKELNRDLLFGETTIPDDLDPEWSFVSAKNAQKRTVHATGWVWLKS